MSEKKVKDLPYGVICHIEKWFHLFNNIDWVMLANLFNKLLSFVMGFNQRDYKIFLENLTPDEWGFMMKFTDDQLRLSKLKKIILKETEEDT